MQIITYKKIENNEYDYHGKHNQDTARHDDGHGTRALFADVGELEQAVRHRRPRGDIQHRDLIVVPESYKHHDRDGEYRGFYERKHDPHHDGEVSRAVYERRFGVLPRQTLEHRVEHEEVHTQEVRFQYEHTPHMVVKP